MGNALFIVWRESIEAMLVIGILHGWLTAEGNLAEAEGRRAKRWLYGGVAAGLALAGGLALVLLGLEAWADGAVLEWLQAGMPLLAAGLIFQMVWWMRRHGAGLKRELESGLKTAASQAHWLGMATLAAVAVGREGAESVVFMYGIAAGERAGSLILGSVLGLALAFVCYGLLVRGSKWISWRLFFRVTEILLLLLGGALLVDGLDKLVGLEVLPALGDPLWDAGTILDDGSRGGGLVAAFTGWRARPIGVSYLALAAWWLLSWRFVLTARPRIAARPA